MYNALRMAGTLVRGEGNTVTVFLMGAQMGCPIEPRARRTTAHMQCALQHFFDAVTQEAYSHRLRTCTPTRSRASVRTDNAQRGPPLRPRRATAPVRFVASPVPSSGCPSSSRIGQSGR